MAYQVILPAAGQGRRMGAGKNKLLLEIDGIPLLIHTLKVFASDELCEKMIVAVNEEEKEEIAQLLAQYDIKKPVTLVRGGSERQSSVYAGVKSLSEDAEIVLVHDAARPFVSHEEIGRLVTAAKEHGAAILAVPVKDTIKKAAGNKVQETVERSSLWAAQTPQAFHAHILRKAHEQACMEQYLGTDDAGLVERIGYDVIIVEGNYDNIKLTTPEDLLFAETIMKKRSGENSPLL